MSAAIFATFVAACILLAVTPGPNMALLIAATLSGGLAGGLMTLAGTLTGLSILVAVAALGMTSVMVLMASWFDLVRWAGAIYLIVLGARQLMIWWRGRKRATSTVPLGVPPSAVSGRSRYLQGLAVSLSNPKVLLFLGAFFPQFVNPQAAPGPQLAVLAVVFLAVLAAVDVTYTVAVARARATIDLKRLQALDLLSGILLVAGGLVLAAARRP
ncbi:MAG: LysE family translocator [Hyphomicrobiaceae bacterium]